VLQAEEKQVRSRRADLAEASTASRGSKHSNIARADVAKAAIAEASAATYSPGTFGGQSPSPPNARWRPLLPVSAGWCVPPPCRRHLHARVCVCVRVCVRVIGRGSIYMNMNIYECLCVFVVYMHFMCVSIALKGHKMVFHPQ
jgi:hypothetical protein